MFKSYQNTRNLRSVLLLGAASAAAIAITAPAAAQDQGGNVETVVVTGSRIPQAGIYSASPVTAIGQQELKLTGTTDVINLLDQLPSVFVAQNATSNNGSSGTATINLRGLGSQRTLVLVDGTRLMPGDPVLPVADINTIPASLVDHIEVLTGGASAVYGSDAVAGVVNFIMRKDFEGVELDAQYSVTENDNNNGYAQGLFNAAGFANPFTGTPITAQTQGITSSVWDGENVDATLIMGSNTENGKGNITAFLSYKNSEPVIEGSRDFSACTLADAGGGTARQCAGSANYSLFVSIDNAVFNPSNTTFFGTGNGSRGSGMFAPFCNPRPTCSGTPNEYFNYGALNYLQRNDTRYNGGFFAHYEENKQLDIYSSFMFTDDKSTSQLAPSAVFAGDGPVSGSFNEVNCTNPYLTAQENYEVCGALPGDNKITTGPIVTALGHPYYDGAGNLYTNEALMEIGRRDIEGGDRTYTTDHESYRMQVGAKGDFGGGWSYDAYAQIGYTTFSEFDGGQFSKSRVQNALQVDPLTGQCLSSESVPPSSSGCVGLDIFNGFGGVKPSMLDYVEVPALTQGFTEEQIISGSVTGDLGEWGLQSPWAKNPLAISVGTEYRQEALGIQPDAEESQQPSGDLEGGSISVPETGRFNVSEGFTELKVPVVQGMPWVEDFTLNGGYRYSSYSTAGSTNAYKYGGEWQPIDDFRIRGSVQRAVRAPNVLELFAPDSLGLITGIQDPCSGAGAPNATVAHNCEIAPGLANVPVKSVGSNLLNCLASQCNGFFGGNTALKPEKSITHSLGVVLTPTFFDGFTATVDYFDIQIEDAIGTIPGTTILSECYGAGATASSMASFCKYVDRNPLTHQITGTGSINQENLNTGALGTKGFDFEMNYNTDLQSMGVQNAGSLSFNLIGTWLDTLTVEPVAGLGSYDCAGLYGDTCSAGTNSGAPNPRWRHKFRVTWTSPWDFSLSAAWRYFGSVNLDQNTKQPLLEGSPNPIEANIPDYNWFDLVAEYDVTSGVTLRAGCDNIFDREPPITAIQPLPEGNGNTFPGSYDALGRVIFVNATVKY